VDKNKANATVKPQNKPRIPMVFISQTVKYLTKVFKTTRFEIFGVT